MEFKKLRSLSESGHTPRKPAWTQIGLAGGRRWKKSALMWDRHYLRSNKRMKLFGESGERSGGEANASTGSTPSACNNGVLLERVGRGAHFIRTLCG